MNECISWLIRHREHLPINSAMLDVGAYHGDFTEKSLQADLFSKAWLFEPNHENLKILRQILFKKPVTIVDVAVSDFVGRGSFHYDRNFATGSLLPYCESGGRQCDGKIETTQMPQITLDHFYEELPTDQKISLIKIDTQGVDLRVLNDLPAKAGRLSWRGINPRLKRFAAD